jgi:hypothetical protein
MATAGGVVAADEFGRRRVEEHHAHVVTGGAKLTDLVEHLGVLATGDQCQSIDVARRFGGEFDDRADQRRRQVVDDEPTEILQDVGDAGAAGAGQPGDQHDVGHGATIPIPSSPAQR